MDCLRRSIGKFKMDKVRNINNTLNCGSAECQALWRPKKTEEKKYVGMATPKECRMKNKQK
jgi:hypothetical protein